MRELHAADTASSVPELRQCPRGDPASAASAGLPLTGAECLARRETARLRLWERDPMCLGVQRGADRSSFLGHRGPSSRARLGGRTTSSAGGRRSPGARRPAGKSRGGGIWQRRGRVCHLGPPPIRSFWTGSGFFGVSGFWVPFFCRGALWLAALVCAVRPERLDLAEEPAPDAREGPGVGEPKALVGVISAHRGFLCFRGFHGERLVLGPVEVGGDVLRAVSGAADWLGGRAGRGLGDGVWLSEVPCAGV